LCACFLFHGPLAARALSTAQLKGAQYADIRLCHSLEQSLSVKNGHVDGLSHTESLGFGVRVLVDGAWGFAAWPDDVRLNTSRRRERAAPPDAAYKLAVSLRANSTPSLTPRCASRYDASG